MSTGVRYSHSRTISEQSPKGRMFLPFRFKDEPELKGRFDILFLGGAPYANTMDPELRSYPEKLSPEMVGKVALFTIPKSKNRWRES